MSLYNSKLATWWRRRRHHRYVAAIRNAKDAPHYG